MRAGVTGQPLVSDHDGAPLLCPALDPKLLKTLAEDLAAQIEGVRVAAA